MVSTAGSNNILHLAKRKSPTKSRNREFDAPSDESILQRRVKQYLSVGRKDNALNWAWHATAALIGTRTTRGLQLHQGIIGVRTSGKDYSGNFDVNISNTFQYSYRNANFIYPAVVFSQSAVKRPNYTQRYLSIFNTLGLISNLLDINTSNTQNLYESIFKQLSKIESVQTVSLPNWDDPASRDEEFDTGINDIDHYSDAPMKMALAHHIASWLIISNNLKSQSRPSAVLLGKIWNRLYFSLDNISSAMRAENQNEARCSKSMQLFAWALINAFLVEEVEYHHREREDINPSQEQNDFSGIALIRNNPRTSGDSVIEKFRPPEKGNREIRLNITPQMAPLAFTIASCPLVLGLIKNSPESNEFVDILNAKLKAFRSGYDIPYEVLCSQEAWDHIGQTAVSG